MQVNRDPNMAQADDGSAPEDQATPLAPKPKPVNLAPVPLGAAGAPAAAPAAPSAPSAPSALPPVAPISSVPPTAPVTGSPVGPTLSVPQIPTPGAAVGGFEKDSMAGLAGALGKLGTVNAGMGAAPSNLPPGTLASAAGTGSRSDPNGPNLGSSGMGAMPQGETIQSLVASAGQNAPKPPLAPKALDTPPAGGLAGWTPSATPPVVSGGSSPGARWTTFDASKSAAMSPADTELNRRIQSGDPALMNEYKQKYGADWFSKWGADQDRLAAMKNNQTGGGAGLQNLGGLSGQDAWNKIAGNLENFNALRAMSPEQRTAFLNQWAPGSYDRQLMEGSLASQGITPANADTGRRWDGKTANMGAMASAIPVYDQVGGGPAANVQGEAFPGYNPETGKIDQPTGITPQPVGGGAGGSPVPPIATVPTAAPVGGVTANPGGVVTRTAPPMVNNAPTGASSGAGASSAAGAPGVSTAPGLTPYTADDNFLNKIISRAPTADRFKLAQDKFGQFETDTNPAFENANRTTLRMGAAAGGLGSGDLRTSVANLNDARTKELGNERSKLFTDALQGTIADSFGDAGIAQQQQGFQANRSDTAFNQGVTEAQLKDTLTNSSFGRALQQLVVGQGGSPADALMTLSAILSGQAGQAGQSLTDLIRGNATSTAANNAGGGGSSGGSIADWLKNILASGTKATTATSGIPSSLPTGVAIGGGTGPTNPLAVGR